MTGGEFLDTLAISCVNAISEWQPSLRFGGNFCRPSARCSHLSPSDSGTLEAKFSPAIRTSNLVPGIHKFLVMILKFYDIYILLMTCFAF
jgi:hypothetical protein